MVLIGISRDKERLGGGGQMTSGKGGMILISYFVLFLFILKYYIIFCSLYVD